MIYAHVHKVDHVYTQLFLNTEYKYCLNAAVFVYRKIMNKCNCGLNLKIKQNIHIAAAICVFIKFIHF